MQGLWCIELYEESRSGPNAVKEGDILLGLEKPGDPLVLRAMLCCDQGRAFEVLAKAYLGRIRVALEQKRLFQRAGRAEAGGRKKKP